MRNAVRYRVPAGLACLVGACAVVAYVVSLPVASAEATYVGNAQCKVCHNKAAEGEQWNKWKETKHASAVETLKGDAAKAIAEKKGLTTPAHESPECLKCHVTAYNEADCTVPEKLKIEEGVQCETCHGPSSDHLVDGKAAMLKKDEAALARIRETRGEVDKKLCETCHNDQSPTWNAEKYTKEDGTKTGFDFDQAFEKVKHPNPVKAAAAAPTG